MIYKKIVLATFAVFAFTNFGFSQSKVQDEKFDKKLERLLSHDVNEVAPKDIGSSDATLFLDSREWEEYETSHLQNALFVGYKNFDLERISTVPKDKKIVVYCSVGYRSEKIAEKLEKAGFENVSNLYGGIFEWVNEGNSVYNADGKTDKVHTFNKNWSKWLLKGKKVY